MRRLFLTLLFVLAPVGSLAQMWNPGGNCATCYVVGYVDIPQNHVVQLLPQSDTEWGATGWDFRCADGAGPDRIDAFWFDVNGWGHPMPSSFVTFDRPDVRAAYVQSCPNVWWSGNTGWWVDIKDVPAEAYGIGINLWVGPYRLEASGPFLPSFYWPVIR